MQPCSTNPSSADHAEAQPPSGDADSEETFSYLHPADALLTAIESVRAPVCVGIDPVIGRLPKSFSRAEPTASFGDFVAGVLEAVNPHVRCVKFQSACYERYGSAGVVTLERSIAQAKSLGLHVILDAKRGDIGISAEHYAAGVFDVPTGQRADWITANTYLGEDGLVPFLKAGGGVFALVRTSNPSGDALQSRRLESGETIAERVGEMVAHLGNQFMGRKGYSALGAVVGATKPADAALLRKRMPQQLLLVPGFGAQGGRIKDVLPCFNSDGSGAVVTASRSILYSFDESDSAWLNSIEDAAAEFAEQVGRAVGLRR